MRNGSECVLIRLIPHSQPRLITILHPDPRDKPVDIARGVARGDLHPETELPIFDMYKDQKGMVPRNFTNSVSETVFMVFGHG